MAPSYDKIEHGSVGPKNDTYTPALRRTCWWMVITKRSARGYVTLSRKWRRWSNI